VFTNYIKVAIRNLKKHKGYSFINILGLSVGMACTILILLWVQDELSYDRFLPDSDRLYRVIDSEKYPNGEESLFSLNPPSLAPELVNQYPDIVNAARLRTVKSSVIQYDDKRFNEDNLTFVDPSFLKMFGISFINGNNNNALSNVFSIVMTQEMAEKYFGSEEPIGKTVRIDNRFDFPVTGIIKNYPSNSHLKIDFLLPFQAVENFGFTLEGWNSFAHTTYVSLAKGTDYQTVSSKIKNTIIRNENDEKITISLQPAKDIHLYSNKMIGIGGTGDITQVYIFSVIALLILLLACINFMNLSTARAGNRSKEIGMRKVVGARRKEIILQFFFESIVYAVISLMLSIFWIYDLLPLFNSISGKELTFNILNNSEILLVILGVAIFTGILSGIYPALVMSAFKPVKVLKGSFRLGSGNKIFRKILVTSQFVLTIVLITGTVVVNRQLHFVQNKSLGFNKDQLLCIKLPGELNRKFDLIKDRLQENRGVINIAGVSYPPSGILRSADVNDWEGRKSDNPFLTYILSASYDFVKTMQVKMDQGRFYSKEFKTDTAEGCIINVAALNAMDMKSPVGKKVLGLKILGVMQDFNFTSLHSKVAPLLIYYDPTEIKYLLIRIQPNNVSRTISSLDETWTKIASDFPFEYSFLDEQIDKLYSADQRAGNVINVFSFLALFIACLGIFGLASFTAEQRVKEVGIRKVLGAKVSGIVLLLSKEYAKYVLLANLFAIPVAYYAIDRWLQNFAYRVTLDWWMFLISGGIAIVIALSTVSIQVVKAATANPVQSLKYE